MNFSAREIKFGFRQISLLILTVSMTACSPNPPVPLHKMSREQLEKLAAEARAQLPLEVREKLDAIAAKVRLLPRPTRLDKATLRTIADEDLDYAIDWYVVERFRQNAADRERVVTSFPIALRNFYRAWLVEAEVSNGGFNQYFWNVSAGVVSGTSDALRQIGADQAAEILDEAVILAAEEAPMRNRLKADDAVLKGFSESYKHSNLESLSHRFVALTDVLQAKRIAYVRANEDMFDTEKL